MNKKKFELVIRDSPDDIENDNVDAKIVLEDGRVLFCTFFTIKNIEKLMASYKETGECLFGMYLWASGMIIVEDLSFDKLEKCVTDLIESGEYTAFLHIE